MLSNGQSNRVLGATTDIRKSGMTSNIVQMTTVHELFDRQSQDLYQNLG